MVPKYWLDISPLELLLAIGHLFRFTKLSNDTKVKDFEEHFSNFIGTTHAKACPNCRTGMYYSLVALGFEPGDEVILPAFTWWTDAGVVIEAGLNPVFVDVDFSTRNIDTHQIEKSITPKTKAILVTHLNGLPVDMDEIVRISEKYNLRVIEDCARALGASYKSKKVGSFDIGVFSFGFRKSIYGLDGGMVVARDHDFIINLRKLMSPLPSPTWRNIGKRLARTVMLKFFHYRYAYLLSIFPMLYAAYILNSTPFKSMFSPSIPANHKVPKMPGLSMTNIQAFLCNRQLKRTESNNAKRKENARLLRIGLKHARPLDSSLSLPKVFDDRDDVSVHFAVWHPRKQELRDRCLRNLIEARDESAMDLTQLDLFQRWVHGKFPNAQRLHNKVMFLPNHPHLTKRQLKKTIKVISEED